MLYSSLYTMLKLSKTSSSQKLFDYDCVTLYESQFIWAFVIKKLFYVFPIFFSKWFQSFTIPCYTSEVKRFLFIDWTQEKKLSNSEYIKLSSFFCLTIDLVQKFRKKKYRRVKFLQSTDYNWSPWAGGGGWLNAPLVLAEYWQFVPVWGIKYYLKPTLQLCQTMFR